MGVGTFTCQMKHESKVHTLCTRFETFSCRIKHESTSVRGSVALLSLCLIYLHASYFCARLLLCICACYTSFMTCVHSCFILLHVFAFLVCYAHLFIICQAIFVSVHALISYLRVRGLDLACMDFLLLVLFHSHVDTNQT